MKIHDPNRTNNIKWSSCKEISIVVCFMQCIPSIYWLQSPKRVIDHRQVFPRQKRVKQWIVIKCPERIKVVGRLARCGQKRIHCDFVVVGAVVQHGHRIQIQWTTRLGVALYYCGLLLGNCCVQRSCGWYNLWNRKAGMRNVLNWHGIKSRSWDSGIDQPAASFCNGTLELLGQI